MNRKIIKQGKGGYTIYLPKKWVDEQSLKAGDEINIGRNENQLVLSTEKQAKDKKVEIDTKDMDSGSFMKTIVSHYEMGFSEIIINDTKGKIFTPRLHKEYSKPTSDVINRLINRLIGFEIVSSHENIYVLKDVAMTSPAEFDNILRRIFFLILEFQDKIKEMIENGKPIEDYNMMHDNIAKFISFCIRLLNLNIDKTNIEKNNLHTILTFLDKITDSLRWVLYEYKIEKKLENKKLIYAIMDHFKSYYNLFYNFNIKSVNELDKERIKLRKQLLKCKEPIIVHFSSNIEYSRAMIRPMICLYEVSRS